MPLALLGFLNITLTDILDILMVAAIIFILFRWLRGSSAMNIFVAVIFLYVLKVVVSALNMTLMSGIMSTVLDVGVIALIVIFQPEIRYFLIKLGSRYGFGGSGWKLFNRLFGRKSDQLGSAATDALLDAVRDMSAGKTGALIVIARQDSLQHIIETGDTIDARINKRLLMNLFFKNSPLHDGAVVIHDNRIVAARCTLPLSGKADIPAQYGMRHKAAIGISEASDAHVVVVSEETGEVSFVSDGQICTIQDPVQLRELLNRDSKSASEEEARS
ncbi:MAG: diadenylate cyclase CdaA [Bacteroidales bacterium]|nr:diadenylate cyclase CdaA [Bacteroidales bacterium]